MIEMAMVNPSALSRDHRAAQPDSTVTACLCLLSSLLNVMPVSRNDFPAGIVALNNDPGVLRSFSSMMMV